MESAAVIWAVLGILLLLLTLLDALWTTVSPSGAAPLTALVCRTLWSLASRLPTSLQRRVAPATGTIILLSVILLWIVMLWTGWWLLFSADADAVVHSHSQMSADSWERVYFVGFSLFTLGVGDFTPQGDAWRIATVLASFSGLFLITLSITYLLPVLSSAIQQRQVALMIYRLGRSPAEIISNAWNGRDFGDLIDRLEQIWPMIELHHQRHLAYPVLHYFRSRGRDTSLAVNLAVLDEALLLMRHAIDESHRPRAYRFMPVREAIGSILEHLETAFIPKASDAPPPPDARALPSPPVDNDALQHVRAAADENEHHRRRLRGLVEDAGFSWSNVTEP